MLSRLAFVREQREEAGVTRVLAGMLAGDRRTLGATLLPFAWYGFELAARLDAAITAEFGAGDEVFLLLGARSAEEEMAGRRAMDPHAMLKQTCATYAVFYDTGRRDYERVAAKSGVVRTRDATAVWDANCLVIVGYYRKAIAVSGGKTVDVRHPSCRARSDETCEYVCRWG